MLYVIHVIKDHPVSSSTADGGKRMHGPETRFQDCG
jgi:hypothetical protein